MRYLILLFLLFTLGCQQQNLDEDLPDDPAPAAQEAESASAGGDSTSFSFTLPGEDAASEIKVDQAGIKFGDWEAKETDKGVSVYQSGQIRATGKYKSEGKVSISDAAGNRAAKIKIRDDGSFKVVDANEKLICKVKPKDDGYKVVGSDEETVLIKVKASDGKTKIKDGQGNELAKFKGSRDPLIVTWLAIPDLPKEVRLAAAVLFRGMR